MPARTPQRLIDRAVDLYSRGKSRKEIEARTGLHWNTVRDHVRRAGLPPRPGGPEGYTKKTRERAVRMYLDGDPITTISAETGAEKSTILRWTTAAGVNRNRRDGYTDADRELTIERYQAGEDFDLIAARVGCHVRTVGIWIEAAIERGELDRRPKGLALKVPAKLERALEMYAADATLEAIAKETGIHRSQVLRNAKRRGMTIRPPARRPRIDAQAAHARWKETNSITAVAREMGVSTGGISNAINRAIRERLRAARVA